MTPEAFKAAGEALWGGRWIAPMARSLHCSTRSVRRWAAGSWPVPDGVEHDVALLLATRQAEIADMTWTWKREPVKAPAPIEVQLRDNSSNSPATFEIAHPPGKPPRWMIDEERKKLEKGNQ